MQPFSQINMDTPVVTVPEFCRRTGLKERNVRKKIGDGQIPTLKIGEGKMCTVVINLAKMTEDALARAY